MEIKNTRLDEEAKVPHLSYFGDAEVGAGTNIGAGSITANFDHRPGVPKKRTSIGRNARVAVDTMFVAPVIVGDDVWTAAGTVVTDDVPDNALVGFAAETDDQGGSRWKAGRLSRPCRGSAHPTPQRRARRRTRDRPDAEQAAHARPGRSNPDLAAQIARQIGCELGEMTLKTFASGETYCRYEDSIRGADIFIVQTASAPVDQHLMELLIMINAAKLASAKRITAVVPWYFYVRQDKKSRPREPITAKLVADLLQTAGADRV